MPLPITQYIYDDDETATRLWDCEGRNWHWCWRVRANLQNNCAAKELILIVALEVILSVALIAVIFLAVFSVILFFVPEMGGYFLEYNNFIPADPLKTPQHIAPVWYFTPYYSILRAVPPLFNSQFPGVMAMGLATMILFLLPWLDRDPVKSIRYRGGYFKTALAIFVVTFLLLGYLGTEATNVWGQFGAWMGNADRATVAARVFTVLYFAFFILMPWYTAIDKSKPVPDRVTM